MIGTIYALAEPGTGAIRYCGKTTTKLSYRLSGHRSDAKAGLKRHSCYWLAKIFAAGKEPEVMICETLDLSGLDRVELHRVINEAETRWIAQFKALGFDLTNATSGGDGSHGTKLSPERKAKFHAAAKAFVRTAEWRARIGATKRLAARLHPERILRGERHPMFGKKASQEAIKARAVGSRAWYEIGDRRSKHGTKMQGEKNGNGKLTSQQALAIYLDQRFYHQIGVDYGITATTVCNIKRGNTWAHVTGHTRVNSKAI